MSAIKCVWITHRATDYPYKQNFTWKLFGTLAAFATTETLKTEVDSNVIDGLRADASIALVDARPVSSDVETNLKLRQFQILWGGDLPYYLREPYFNEYYLYLHKKRRNGNASEPSSTSCATTSRQISTKCKQKENVDLSYIVDVEEVESIGSRGNHPLCNIIWM